MYKINYIHFIYMDKVVTIAANWKMNPSTIDDAIHLIRHIVESSKNVPINVKIIVFVPFSYIHPISKILQNTNIFIGAQDCYTEISGAYTGAVSVPMLKSLGCSYILAGHSERRQIFNDTNQIINTKVKLILKSELKCILCIGENRDEYEGGLNKEICYKQLSECLLDCNEEQLGNVIIAYEPIWAIGTGLNATPEIMEDVIISIRNWIKYTYSENAAKKICIQYGGSVNPENIYDVLNQPNVNGVLVGGASLDSENFSKIIHYQ